MGDAHRQTTFNEMFRKCAPVLLSVEKCDHLSKANQSDCACKKGCRGGDAPNKAAQAERVSLRTDFTQSAKMACRCSLSHFGLGSTKISFVRYLTLRYLVPIIGGKY